MALRLARSAPRVTRAASMSVVPARTAATEIVMTLKGAKLIGAGCAAGALGGVGTGVGVVFAGLIVGSSRQPNLQGKFFNYAIMGFAMAEAMGLFAIMIAFMLMFVLAE
eukprot:TRINITY_DN102_c0_g1_i2.p4 TRINITY_DN102_c0_g1~~TRINITY_DN102_c0_g1_i2.p4  ORF type:complete len:109 (-),score=19.44 TRINITY_DN102_c0_g1_i2:424-750(-)